jgi:hypothetical protein
MLRPWWEPGPYGALIGGVTPRMACPCLSEVQQESVDQSVAKVSQPAESDGRPVLLVHHSVRQGAY